MLINSSNLDNNKRSMCNIIAYKDILDEIYLDRRLSPMFGLASIILSAATDGELKTVKADKNYKPYNPSIKGYSTCSPEDKYNDRDGIIIAENKAVLKYHTRMTRDYDKIINKLKYIINILEEKKVKHNKKANNICEKLKRSYGA